MLMDNVYILCEWNENIDEQFFPIVDSLRKQYNRVLGITLTPHHVSISKHSDSFDNIVILNNIYEMIRFIVLHKQKKNIYFMYNHKTLSNTELKIHTAIKLSFADVIYMPRSVCFLRRNDVDMNKHKSSVKKIFYKTLIRKFIINTKIILAYLFFLPFFILKKNRKTEI